CAIQPGPERAGRLHAFPGCYGRSEARSGLWPADRTAPATSSSSDTSTGFPVVLDSDSRSAPKEQSAPGERRTSPQRGTWAFIRAIIALFAKGNCNNFGAATFA